MFVDARGYRFIPADKEKGGEFKLGKMAFHVPARLARTMNKRPERRQVRTSNGEMVDLAKLEGEAVFRVDDIRIEQLGWLSLKRNVEYILVDETAGLVAVSVR